MTVINDFNKRLVPITVGVSGHIDILDRDIETAKDKFLEALSRICENYRHTPLQLLVSLAVGADRIAAKCFIEFRENLRCSQPELAQYWELVVVLPIPIELYKEDFPDKVNEFDELFRQADAVVTMPLQQGASLESIRKPGVIRDCQYQDATRYISVHSDVLIAFWDGNDPGKIGGTHDAIRMRLFGHAVTDRIHYSPLANAATRLVLQIKVGRKSSSQVDKLETRFNENAKFTSSIEDLINAFDDGQEIDSFNLSVLNLVDSSAFNRSLKHLFSADIFEKVQQIKLDYSTKYLIELYATSDALSIRSEKYWSFLTKVIFSFGFATSILLPIAVEDLFVPWTMLAYIFMLSVAFGIYSWIRITRLENKHVESRSLAEFLRVQIAWVHARFNNSLDLSKSKDNLDYLVPNVSTALLGQQLINIGWIGRVLTSLVIVPRNYKAGEVDGINSAIINDWIAGQKIYFMKSQKRAEESAHRIGLLSKIFVLVGILSAFFAIFMSHLNIHEEEIRHFLVICSAAFPIISVVMEKYSENFAYEAKAKINERLYDVFVSAQKLVNNPEAPQSVKDAVVLEAGKEAVAEAMMWFFLRRSRPTKISM